MNSQDAKMIPKSSKMRPESAKMDHRSVPLATPMGHGSPPCGPTCSRKQILMSPGASGLDFGCPRTPIWEDLASILSKRFNSILFHFDSTLFLSIPFHSTPFHSIPFHSIACSSIPPHPIPFHCHFAPPCSGVPASWNSGTGSFLLPRYRPAGFPTSSLQSASAGCAKRKQFLISQMNCK